MATYTAIAAREEGWWTVSVKEVPGLFTQARRLDQIDEMVRDALILFPEVEPQPDMAGIDIVVEESIANQVNTVKELRDKAHQTQEAATAALAQTAKALSAQGLPYRDIGQLLGISFQRAQKISKA